MARKKIRRHPDEFCQMKPLRECLLNNDGKIEKCIKEIEIFEKTCDNNKPYYHSREGMDDSSVAYIAPTQRFNNDKCS
ncbi:hypothetical protein BdWA1_002794 [Babesia duncani]|uniref:CHCH domain-containing protein n=1 Tax=Babesia duncani TaxID=323732 RepID=A0AAD9UNR7_9APIC|nr:hypothetical protein BdWA1_002794 [Babesia duncani]